MARNIHNVDTETADLWGAEDALQDWAAQPMSAFQRWLAGEIVAQRHQFRPTSVDTYTYHFSAWLKYLDSLRCNFLEATHREAETFFAQLEVEPVSRRRYLQLLDRVYRAVRAQGWEGRNPMALELKKEEVLPVADPVSLTDAQVATLYERLKLLDGWKGDRDRAMAGLLLGAGLRANEVIHLPKDAVGKDWSVIIKPRGVHRDHVSTILPGPAREYWENWERDRAALGVGSEVAFPATKKGRPYTESGLFRRIDTWLKLAGIECEERGANLLRNTFARLALQRHTPEEVHEFLGHEVFRATLRHAG